MSWQNSLLKTYLRVGVKSRLTEASLASSREAIDGYLDRYMPPPPRELDVEAIDEAGFRGERIAHRQPCGTASILYLHGGALMSGSAQTHRGTTCGLAMERVGTVWALDYPLAPEHSLGEIQASVDAAFDHVLEHAGDPGSVILAGDQAAAWLAMRLAIRLRDQGKPQPAALVLLCPFFDPLMRAESLDRNHEADPITSRNLIEGALDMVFGPLAQRDPAYSLLEANLEGLPPVLLQCSDLDMLCDDGVRMAEALDAQGGSARLEVWKGVPPGWHVFWWKLPEAQSALRAAAKFILNEIG